MTNITIQKDTYNMSSKTKVNSFVKKLRITVEVNSNNYSHTDMNNYNKWAQILGYQNK
jgi:hypothetical protein